MPVSKTEILLDSTWTDVTDYVRYNSGISITSGQTGETGRIEPSVCNVSLDNRDGRFSPRNPTSPYYGQFVKGTHLRTAVQGPYMHLALNGNTADNATTPDAAALDITGDIDIRIDAALHDWGDNGTVSELIGKHEETGDQRSWWVRVAQGVLFLSWSSDGTSAGTITAASTEAVPSAGVNRLAIRITLDVDNGAAGHTVTFYTADDIDGEWTQLGDATTTAGVTSIFSSTAPLDIGAINDVNDSNPHCMVFAAQIRDGIDGTIVANPDFTAQAEGSTGFTDSAGRVWSLGGEARITRYIPRFYGEINDISVSGDQSGNDSVTEIQASDLMKRLGAASTPQISPLRQELTNPERTGIVAYWPLEDETGSTSLTSFYSAQRMTYTGSPNFAQSTVWLGSAPLPTAGTGVFTGKVSAYTSTTEAVTRLLVAVPSGGVSSDQSLLDVYTSGTTTHWKLVLRTSGSLALRAYNTDGTEVVTTGNIAFGVNGDLSNVHLELVQNGADVAWKILVQNYTDAVDISSSVPGASSSGTLTGYTYGRITKVVIGADGGLGDTVIGHATIATDVEAYDATGDAILGYSGENPNERMERVSGENGITYQTIAHSKSGNTIELGRQPVATTMEILREAAESDRGILYASRVHQGLVYHSRLSLYNQEPVVELDCASGHIGAPLQPVDDDQILANKVTVNRSFGSSATAELTTGKLSTQDPPNGAGLREYSADVSLREDDMLADHANWILHQRTLDEPRFPSIMFKLHGSAYTENDALLHQMLLMRLGDRITITGQPDWLPPDDISQIVVGFSESFTNHEHNLTVVCIPESAYHVAFVEPSVRNYDRADTDGSELVEALTTTETEADVFVTDGPRWVIAAPSLITNYDFEDDLTGWAGNGCTIERVATPDDAPFSSSWSMKLTPDGVAEFPNAGASMVAVTEGRSYTFSGWQMCETSRTVGLNINWFDGAAAYMSTDANEIAVTEGEWNWFEASATAPTGAAFANIAPTVPTFPPSADVLYSDMLTLRATVDDEAPDEFPLDVRCGGEVMRVTACVPSAYDNFGRTTASTWGTADSGQSWAQSGGVAADYNVSGGVGTTRMSTVNSSRLTTTAAPSADIDLYVDITTSATPTGAAISGGPIVRAVNNNDLYHCRIQFSTANAITMSIRNRSGGSDTEVGTAYTAPFTHVAGTYVRVRFQVIGSAIKARIWQTTTPEPGAWHIEATDTTHTAANNVGTRGFSSSGNTNVNPTVNYDNFKVVNPQTFTVERSANGVVKSHTAGTSLSLTRPAYVAL